MNLLKQRHFLLTFQTVFIYSLVFPQTPRLPVGKYGVPVLKDLKTYETVAKADSNKRMIELKKLVPGIRYDLRYASANNFMHRRMYPRRSHTAFLRLPAVRALALVQEELSQKGFGLKIFDAYRPYSVTEKFWELVKDSRYVADPHRGSAHNRGLAVDLTVIDKATGTELAMGTEFDNFTDTAHHAFLQLPGPVLNNRSLLKSVMERYGFSSLETEWWHYSWPNDRDYEVMNLSFKQLDNAE
jgi:D-alanyl-D-alanine dipeptidase